MSKVARSLRGDFLKFRKDCLILADRPLQIESLLDEATAELGKMEFSPMLSTIEADFKIRKSVPLNTTVKIECEVWDPCTATGSIAPCGCIMYRVGAVMHDVS